MAADLIFRVNIEVSTCSTSYSSASELIDLGNSAPDDTGTIAADLNTASFDFDITPCTGWDGMQENWDRDLAQLNQDLSSMGQPTLPMR